MNIYYDKSLKTDFLKAQKLDVDKMGYIVDTKTGKRIKDEDKREVKFKSFGGIRKGSRIFLAENIRTVVREAEIDR
ncbi:MAG: hypothetical protein WBP22_06255 [Candidatus Saccharimonas sp.]